MITFKDFLEEKSSSTENTRIGGAKKAFDMGFDDAISSRPKKNADRSFGPYAKDYYTGYSDGQASNDHEAWQEKTAANKDGRNYHE